MTFAQWKFLVLAAWAAVVAASGLIFATDKPDLWLLIACLAIVPVLIGHRLWAPPEATLVLTLGLALAALIGLSLGLLGGGGSILTVPALVYVLGVPAKSAIAMSLPIVGVTSLLGGTLVDDALHRRSREGLVLGGTNAGADMM